MNDREAITDLIYRYCRAMDRIDHALGYSIWHEDGTADYGHNYQGSGRGFIDHVCAQHAGLQQHSHQISNIIIELDGDKAGSESYVTGTMRLERGGKRMAMEVCGRYLDIWEKRGGHWGLIHRTVVFDHQSIREDTPMPGHGTPSARDLSDPSYTVLKG